MKKKLYIFSFIIGILMVFVVGCSNDSSANSNSADENQTESATRSNEEEQEVEEEQPEQTDERIVATTVAITEFMDVLEIDLVGIPSSYKNLRSEERRVGKEATYRRRR